MDEELAKKMQEEEERALKEVSAQDTNESAVRNDGEFEYYDEEDFEDYVFYDDVDAQAPVEEELTEDETPTTVVPTETIPKDTPADTSGAMTDEELAKMLAEEEDYLAALELQREMDSQYQQTFTRVSGNPNGHGL